MKKNFLYFCILFIIASIIILFYAMIRFDYTNDIIPPTTYHIRINRFTKGLKVHEYHSCSYANCKPTIKDYSTKITSKEYSYVSSIIRNRYSMNELITALSYIAKDKEVYCDDTDDYYDVEEDTNHDGKVTYREIGDNRLYQIYKN